MLARLVLLPAVSTGVARSDQERPLKIDPKKIESTGMSRLVLRYGKAKQKQRSKI